MSPRKKKQPHGFTSAAAELPALAPEFLRRALDLMAELPGILLAGDGGSDFPDAGINAALKRVGEFLGVSRAYVMLDEDGGRFLRNTHEWVNRNIGPAIPSWPLHDYKKDIPSLKPLMQDRPYLAAHARNLPPDFRQVLEKQVVDSVLLLPMRRAGAWIGLVGVDNCGAEREWRPEEAAILRCLADLVPTALALAERQDLRQRLEQVHEALGGMFETSPPQSPRLDDGDPGAGLSLLAAERKLIIDTLARHRGNRAAAAKQLGIAWAALNRRCKKLGIRVRKG